MSISYAQVVGELSPGFITVVLNPDETGTDAVNNTGTELIATLPLDMVPLERGEPDMDIWFALARLTDGSKKIFPMNSDEIPGEYYSWLEANGISSNG